MPDFSEFFTYNPDTGHFIWKLCRGNLRKGAAAGPTKRGDTFKSGLRASPISLIVDAEDFVPVFEQRLTQMRTKKGRAPP